MARPSVVVAARASAIGWTGRLVPPPKGFFEIRQFPNGLFPNQPGIFEPMSGILTDGEGLTSSRADTHVLRFTVKLPDLPATELYSAELPATVPVVPVNPGDPPQRPLGNNPQINAFPTGQNIVYSRWAEIQYFLRPNGDVTPNGTNNAAQLPLYSLRAGAAAGLGGQNYLMMLPDATTLMAQYPDVAMVRVGPGRSEHSGAACSAGRCEQSGFNGTTVRRPDSHAVWSRLGKLSPAA